MVVLNRAAWTGCAIAIIVISARGIAQSQIPAFKVLSPQPLGSLDPMTGRSGGELRSLIHCGLIAYQPSGQLTGELAESWTWPDPKTVKFQIKQVAKFSDGTPVTTIDVKTSLDAIVTRPVNRVQRRLAARIKQIDAADRFVTITMHEADASIIADLDTAIVPALFHQGATKDAKFGPPGCGPMKLTSLQQTSVTLIRNPFYTLGPTAPIDELGVEFGVSQESAEAEIIKGTANLLVMAKSSARLRELSKRAPNFRIQMQPGGQTSYLGFNVGDKSLADIRTRKAISLGIDRGRLIKLVLDNAATEASGLFSPGHPYYSSALSSDLYDPNGSARLLEDAGMKRSAGNEWRLTLSLTCLLDPLDIEIAKAIAAELKKIAIKVSVRPVTADQFVEDSITGNLQLWLASRENFGDPRDLQTMFGSALIPPAGDNIGRYSNPQLDGLLQKGLAEVDLIKRREIYDRVQTAIASDVPGIFLWQKHSFDILGPKVKSYQSYPSGSLRSLLSLVIDRK